MKMCEDKVWKQAALTDNILGKPQAFVFLLERIPSEDVQSVIKGVLPALRESEKDSYLRPIINSLEWSNLRNYGALLARRSPRFVQQIPSNLPFEGKRDPALG